MTIRYKLFLIVGVLFFAIFVGTFFIEFYLAKKGVEKTQENIHSFYVNIEEYKRTHVDQYLSAVLSARLGEINALLEVVSKFHSAQKYFAPVGGNIIEGTWKSSASLLEYRNQLAFIQNTYENEVTSLIVPKPAPLEDTTNIPIDDNMSWIFLANEEKPYLGLSLTLKADAQTPVIQELDSVPGVIPKAYVLYTTQAIEQFPLASFENKEMFKPSSSLSFPFLAGYSLDLENFLQSMKQAKDFLQNRKGESFPMRPPAEPLSNRAGSCADSLECYLGRKIQYINEIFMIWELASLLESGLAGDSWESAYAPMAMSYFPLTGKGEGVYVKTVFASSPIFPDQSFYQDNPSKQVQFHISSSVAVIPYLKEDRLFLGNTAKVSVGNKTSFVTLGFDLDTVLQDLSLSLHQMSFAVSNGKILSAINSEGKKMPLPAVEGSSLDPFLAAPSGIIQWQGQNYYFIHMQPYPNVDLHFILLNFADKEFSLMVQLNNEIKSVIDAVNVDRRYVIIAGLVLLLLALLNLSKKITGSVVALADAAKDIQAGRLNEVKIPVTHFGKRNEIQKLCDAFRGMVEGLKEKEKVKGILNKVVSQDIAKEILKGDVHLGGEEREVTIFFADIRHFTQITQKMSPVEVIELINTCMTKIAVIIDEHHGVIDKYVGDEIMVLFGAPLHREDSAFLGIKCALKIIEELHSWNIERTQKQLPAIEMGIGIHTGKVLAGNMGAENRLNYTVIGSNVNLASRLCSIAKKGEILISQETLADPFIAKNIDVEDLGNLPLKGFDESHHVFRVKGLK